MAALDPTLNQAKAGAFREPMVWVGEMRQARIWWIGVRRWVWRMVNSFIRYKRRGTWRHPATGRWHELDGFLVSEGETQRMVRKVWTRDEREFLDHRPVCMGLNVERRRWRTEVRKERRVPRVRWEGLMNEEKR